MSKHIFYISSYPKSGNTLMRLIITSLFFSKDGVCDFNKLYLINQLENTKILEFIKDINLNDFNNLSKVENIYKYHILMKKKKNLGFEEDFSFFKSHHIFSSLNNYKYVDVEQVRGVIYIIRDPRDIVLSWSNYSNTSIDKSIDFIINKNSMISWDEYIYSNLPKNTKPKVLISNWSNHINSIKKIKNEVPFLLIKYEELINKKEKILNEIIYFFKKYYNIEIINKDNKIKNIVESSNFLKLKKMEKDNGFKEKQKGNFFNKGIAGSWINSLNKKQIEKIESQFSKEMTQYDYTLNSNY